MSTKRLGRIIIRNYASSSNSIYFGMRQRLTLAQIEGLRYIDGVTRYESFDYNVHVSTGEAFTFSEIAPRALIVLADALGISLDEIEVVVKDSFRKEDQPLADQALIDAKEIARASEISAITSEITLIDDNIDVWRTHITQWRARKRQLLRELKKFGVSI